MKLVIVGINPLGRPLRTRDARVRSSHDEDRRKERWCTNRASLSLSLSLSLFLFLFALR